MMKIIANVIVAIFILALIVFALSRIAPAKKKPDCDSDLSSKCKNCPFSGQCH
ncbi:MAG: hypothetical protein BWY50_01665 [Spirochaetes bacterium ADurb.Bin315]|jgi:hypothetical protein|nr:MAG: hypothetical protein BWY50_01665 [Spirochaetes bacterium ADurb.Bin315]